MEGNKSLNDLSGALNETNNGTKEVQKPSPTPPLGTAKKYFVLHFTSIELDEILQKNNMKQVETFKETFLGLELIKEEAWLKVRSFPNCSESYSLKRVTRNGSFLACTELQEKRAIETELGEVIETFEPFVTFHVKRWEKTIGEGKVQIRIDSSRTATQEEEGVHNFYVSCSCRGEDPETILSSLKEMGFGEDSIIHPIQSKAKEYLKGETYTLREKGFFSDEEDYELMEDEYSEEYGAFSHRLGDPLDSRMTLFLQCTKEEVAEWCAKRLNGRFSKEFQMISSGMDAKEIYSKSLPELMELSNLHFNSRDIGIALYYYVHLWRSPLRHKEEDLKNLAKENIYILTRYEIGLVLGDKMDKSLEVKCKERREWLYKVGSDFQRWQLRNKLEETVFVG